MKQYGYSLGIYIYIYIYVLCIFLKQLYDLPIVTTEKSLHIGFFGMMVKQCRNTIFSMNAMILQI